MNEENRIAGMGNDPVRLARCLIDAHKDKGVASGDVLALCEAVLRLSATLADARYVVGAFARGADPHDYAREIADLAMEGPSTEEGAGVGTSPAASSVASAPAAQKTLLDEFAMAALPGLMGRAWGDPVTGLLPPDIFNTWATSAFAIAAEMLAARAAHLPSEH